MFNRRFTDAVRHRLINVLGSVWAPAPKSGSDKEDLVIFLDYQNFYFLLKNGYKVPPKQTNIPALLREFVGSHGMVVKDIYLYTGIPDQVRDPVGHKEMEKRLAFWRRSGVIVRALPVLYIFNKDTGKTVVKEKGIDVTLASELVKTVMEGATKVLVGSNDKDIAQAIRIAGEVALSKNIVLDAYSITPSEVDLNSLRRSGLGVDGIHFTRRLELPASMVNRHVSFLDRKTLEAPSSEVQDFEERQRS